MEARCSETRYGNKNIENEMFISIKFEMFFLLKQLVYHKSQFILFAV